VRFEEFVARNGIAVAPVDRFDGFSVDVGIPPDWEPFDSAVGIGVWVGHSDPRLDRFCANAVLTLHHVEASLDVGEVFAMLSEQQLQSVPGAHELRRELVAAAEGPGFAGELAMRIAHELGTLDSMSRSRIIATEQETLIAQLTVTALTDSPATVANIWLSVRLGPTVSHLTTGDSGCRPVSRIRDTY
jgi:hypothetical protein